MKKCENLEYATDLKIKVFGKAKEELFSNALLGAIEDAGLGKNIRKNQKRNEDKIF